MPMTINDLAWTRAQVGTQPDDATLNTAFDRIGGKAGVALEVWYTRLANFEASPASLGADGLSIGSAANIEAIQKRIAKLEILARAEGSYVASPGSGFMCRGDRRDILGSDPSESDLYALEAAGPFPYGGDGGVL